MDEQITQTALARIENTVIVKQLNSPDTLSKFDSILGEGRALHFVTSLKVVFAANKDLMGCTPESLINGAMQGAGLGLSFDPSLGEAFLVPFNKKIKIKGQPDRWEKQATFIPGYKGFIQLAIKSGLFKRISGMPVTERMLQKIQEISLSADDPQIETIRFLEGVEFFPEMSIGWVVGYVAYFVLKDGFPHMIFWTKEKCLQHGKLYSKNFDGYWTTSEDIMCLKTVYLQLFKKFAPRSKQMQTAIEQESQSLAMLEEPRGYYGSLGSGNEDEELFGVTDEPVVEKAHTEIEKVWKQQNYHPAHIKKSVKLHLGTNSLEECKDVGKLREYYTHLTSPKEDTPNV